MTSRSRWRPVDWMIFVIVCAVSIVFVAAVVVPLYHNTPLPEMREKFLWAAIGSVISIASVYVGNSMRDPRDTIEPKDKQKNASV